MPSSALSQEVPMSEIRRLVRPHALRGRGFSLMELMVVIAILGILATLVVTNVIPYLMKGRQTKVKADIGTIKAAITSYYAQNNRLPDTIDQLTQPDPKNFNETYIDEGQELVDPWGNPYVFTREGGNKYTILSYGADGIPGGEPGSEDEDISDKTMNKKSDQ
jgi:general secretion pathway protein G